MTLPFHPLANLFPMMTAEEHASLVADMRANGYRAGEEIVLLDGMILDGRNRYMAAVEAGIIPAEFVPGRDTDSAGWLFCHFDVEGIDGIFTDQEVEKGPLAFVISKNLNRRHLSTSQRSLIAAELEGLGWGGNRSKPSNEGLSLEARAEALKVGRASVERAETVIERGVPELKDAVRSGDLAVAPAADVAKLPAAEQSSFMAALPRDEHGKLTADAKREVVKLAKEIRGGEINGARAIMGSRQEPDDSLDYFPTNPWATRALMERVLPTLGVTSLGGVWEPACGEGHIADVLREYSDVVHASDVFDYGYRGLEPLVPGDFLDHGLATAPIDDWIVTNPPFGNKAIQFVLHALKLVPNVAMFFRSQWAVEGIERYEAIFRDRPPTLCAYFVERVNLCKGRWDPDGTTATAYCWLVWMKGETPRPPLWIPPGCREALTRDGDRERFTAHPVVPIDAIEAAKRRSVWSARGASSTASTSPRKVAGRSIREADRVGGISSDGPADAPPIRPASPATLPTASRGEGGTPGIRIPPPADDELEIPAFLRRTKQEAA